MPDYIILQDIKFKEYRFPTGTSFTINEVLVSNKYKKPEAFYLER